MYSRTQLLLSIDPSLGRVDKHSFSQQALMELLVSSVGDAEKIYQTEENLGDMTSWAGLSLNAASTEVHEIKWRGYYLHGSLDLNWIPSTVRRFDVSQNNLEGALQLSALGAKMVSANFGYNQFSGTIDLTKLPEALTNLSLTSTIVSGDVDFRQLPRSLLYLDVSDTTLSGNLPTETNVNIHTEKATTCRLWVPIFGTNANAMICNTSIRLVQM